MCRYGIIHHFDLNLLIAYTVSQQWSDNYSYMAGVRSSAEIELFGSAYGTQ